MPCAVAEPVEGLATGLLILLLPVLLTLPLRFGWKWWVGMEPEHEHYREKVRRVLDSGIPIKRYRTELDSEARRLLINKERQSRIESDLLRPLGPQHFLLLPALIFSPLLGIFAFFVTIILLPMIRPIEWILIDKGLLSYVANIIRRVTRWEIIGIPRLDDGTGTLDRVLDSTHRMPITVFLGIFAFLIVLYLPLEPREVMVFSAVFYIFLVSVISVIRAATMTSLVFADPTKRRLIPMHSLVDDALGPSVGIGLIFLLSRQLIYGSQLRSGDLLGDPVVFSISVLLVLYTATIIGVAVEFAFFDSRSDRIKSIFQMQIVERHDPMVYLFTRHLGTLRISPLMTMREWIDNNEEITLVDSDFFDN